MIWKSSMAALEWDGVIFADAFQALYLAPELALLRAAIARRGYVASRNYGKAEVVLIGKCLLAPPTDRWPAPRIAFPGEPLPTAAACGFYNFNHARNLHDTHST